MWLTVKPVQFLHICQDQASHFEAMQGRLGAQLLGQVWSERTIRSGVARGCYDKNDRVTNDIKHF